MNIETGKAKQQVRPITLLDSGANVVIEVSEWNKASSDSFAKEFDAKETKILRVWKHVNGAGFMIYGMLSKKGKIVNDAYEIVAIESMVPHALDQVAAHCGVEDLIDQVSL